MKSMVNLWDETPLPSHGQDGSDKPLILQGERQSCPMIGNQRGEGDAWPTRRCDGTGTFGGIDQVMRGDGMGAGRARRERKARVDARGPSPKSPPAPHTGGSVLTPIAFFAFAARQVVVLAQNFDAKQGSGETKVFTARPVCFLRGSGLEQRQAADADPAFRWPSAARLSTGGGRGL